MFRASSAYLQEVNDVNCTCMRPLVFSFSAGGRVVHLLRGVHKTATCREWEYQRLHTCTINIIDFLKKSGWRSKHVEDLILCNLYKKIVYQVGINKGIIPRCTAYQISRFAISLLARTVSIFSRFLMLDFITNLPPLLKFFQSFTLLLWILMQACIA